MAEKDLYSALQELDKSFQEKSQTESFRAGTVDTWEHRFEVSKAQLVQEILIQLTEVNLPDRKKRANLLSVRAKEVTPDLATGEEFLVQNINTKYKKIADKVATKFMQQLALNFKADAKRVKHLDVNVSITPSDLIVTVTPIDKTIRYATTTETIRAKFDKNAPAPGPASAYNFVQGILGSSVRRSSKDRGKRTLLAMLEEEGVVVSAEETFFNLGHVTAVSAIRAGSILRDIKNQNQEVLVGLMKYARISELLNRHGELLKKFETQVAYVRPQSVVGNNLASHYEKQILNEVTSAISDLYKEAQEKDWANAKGSDSILEAIALDLISTAKKTGAKVKSGQSRKPSYGKSKATLEKPLKVKHRTTTTRANNVVGDIGLSQLQAVPSRVNLRMLIPLLNQRLPDIVRSHMGQQGRLTNRTGRFSESTQIVDIDENSFVTYTYMLNPYSVYEQQGPRDPRPLIEQSIRELAAGRLRVRFGMRRV